MSAAEGQYVTLGMGAEVFAVPGGRGTPLIDLRTTLDRSATEPAPRVSTRRRQDFIRCLAKRNGDFIVFPNLPRDIRDVRPIRRTGLDYSTLAFTGN